MAALETQGISLHYETFGDRRKPPVLLLAGLGGTGQTFGPVVSRFAERYFVVLPDQRGTGQTTRSEGGYTIPQVATDMAALIEHLDLGPVHVVGSSTGGMITQTMALDHPRTVRSATIVSSYARPDAYVRRQFALRRGVAATADASEIFSCYAIFLFSPRWAARHPEAVEAWIARAASRPVEREVTLKRIDMVLAHDQAARLGQLRQPTLLVCGDQDLCCPLHLSEELAAGIPGSELVVLPGGHFIDLEDEEKFFDTVSQFIDRH
jgi:aminoacrylate hydrolase